MLAAVALVPCEYWHTWVSDCLGVCQPVCLLGSICNCGNICVRVSENACPALDMTVFVGQQRDSLEVRLCIYYLGLTFVPTCPFPWCNWRHMALEWGRSLIPHSHLWCLQGAHR